MFFNLFHKKKNIDDLIKATDNKISVTFQHFCKEFIIGFGEPTLIHGFNCQMMHHDIRLFVDENLIIQKISLTYKKDDKAYNIANDIELNTKFKSNNTILMDNLKYLAKNISKIENMRGFKEEDISRKRIELKDTPKEIKSDWKLVENLVKTHMIF